MPVGFGFGVGDFIATIKLFKDVASALKDQGGAFDDYQKTLRNLETTSAILSCLANFNESSSDTASVNAIRSLAHLIQKDVDTFLTKIDKYKLTLGARNSRISLVSVAPKIKWSQYVTGQVGQLNQDIDIKTGSLKLLLDLHISHATNAILKEQRKAQEQQHQLQRAIGQHAVLQAASDAVNRDVLTHTRRDIEQALSKVKYLFDSLDTTLSVRDDRIASSMATRTDVQELKMLLQTQIHASASTQTHTMSTKDVSRFTLVLMIPSLSISRREMANILQHFSSEVEGVLKIFLASFFVSLRDLLLALPQLIMVYRILQRLPQAISLVLHDNITFEDALGRVQSLQFQQFKNWNVFEACLRSTFELVPGMQKVSARSYVLTSPAYKGQLTPQNWSTSIRPGFVVNMSMSMTKFFAEGRWCPRGCGSGTKKVTGSEYLCRACGLLFTVRKEGQLFSTSQASTSTEGTEDAKHARASIDAAALYTQKPDIRGPYCGDLLAKATEILLETEAEELRVFKRIHLAEASSSSYTQRLPPKSTLEQLGIQPGGLESAGHLVLSESSQTTVVPRRVDPEIASSVVMMLGQRMRDPVVALPPLSPDVYSSAECNILAVTQLPEMVNDEELVAIFSMQEGFRSLYLVCLPHDRNNCIGLVDFEDGRCASQALFNLGRVSLHNSAGYLRVGFLSTACRFIHYRHTNSPLDSGSGLYGYNQAIEARTATARFRDEKRRSRLLACQHKIALTERYLQRGDPGGGQRWYLEGMLRRYQAIETRLHGDNAEGQAHQAVETQLRRDNVEEEAQQSQIKESKTKAVMDEEPLEPPGQQRAVKENPFLKALRAKGVKSLKEMADKTGQAEKKASFQ